MCLLHFWSGMNFSLNYSKMLIFCSINSMPIIVIHVQNCFSFCLLFLFYIYIFWIIILCTKFISSNITSINNRSSIHIYEFGTFIWIYCGIYGPNQWVYFQQIPLSHISEPVYKTSIDWINKRSLEALGSFVLWSLDSILADLVSQQSGAKGSRKGVPQASSKSQVTCC